MFPYCNSDRHFGMYFHLCGTWWKHFQNCLCFGKEGRLDHDLFPMAVMTNYCKVSSLKQHKFVLSQFQKTDLKSRHWQSHALSKGPGENLSFLLQPLVAPCILSCVPPISASIFTRPSPLRLFLSQISHCLSFIRTSVIGFMAHLDNSRWPHLNFIYEDLFFFFPNKITFIRSGG